MLLRMRNASILFINIQGLNTEAVKNIVLAGVGNITIMDNAKVKAEDLGAQFFLSEKDIGKDKATSVLERIQNLNPKVKLEAVISTPKNQPDKFFHSFDFVIATGLDIDDINRLNKICRDKKIKFFAAQTFGIFGYIFADLQHHEYIEEISIPAAKRGQDPEIKRTKKSQEFVPLEMALKKSWTVDTSKPRWLKKLKMQVHPAVFAVLATMKFQNKYKKLPSPTDSTDYKTLKNLLTEVLTNAKVPTEYVDEEVLKSIYNTAPYEISPVCAIVGGFIAQEVLKTLSGKGRPIYNMFVYSGDDGAGVVVEMV
ncbi:hypothetical protein BKA69DRAFT_1073178 [Paraphysoderma sedebokerense]|nr:hypothetical protein BKA69DRAFT_1073178 [Paraphysoderma sedebokerense]